MAQGQREALPEFLLGGGHLGILAVPQHHHAHPRLADLIEALKPFLVRRRDSHPRIDQAQARRNRPSVSGPVRSVLVEGFYGRRAAETCRQIRGVLSKRLRGRWAVRVPHFRRAAIVVYLATFWQRAGV